MTFKEYLIQRERNIDEGERGRRIGSWIGRGVNYGLAGLGALAAGAGAATGNIPLAAAGGGMAGWQLSDRNRQAAADAGGDVGDWIGDKFGKLFGARNPLQKTGEQAIKALQNWKQQIANSRKTNPNLITPGMENGIDKVISQIQRQNQKVAQGGQPQQQQPPPQSRQSPPPPR